VTDIRELWLEDIPVCSLILRSLPDWFGIEESNLEYDRNIATLPTLVATDGDEVVGFVSVKHHSDSASEIQVMGVRPDYHRSGIGRRLLEAAEAQLPEGVEFLQVKTLGPSHPDPFYRRTRAFYVAMGFVPLEETTRIWGAENPTLIMIKYLGKRGR
jgi:ribosomal protein S18 acetylase RimI-like enzyme